MIIGIIPARYASKRFPGKALALLEGKPLIQHVYERSSACEGLSEVVIATDDDRIFDAVQSFGGKCIMTSPNHGNGTERCAEVASKISAEHYVNIQGDEPLIEPSQIQTVCDLLLEGAGIATLKKRLEKMGDLEDPNVVKVITAKGGRALYFSRSVVPYPRNTVGYVYYRHIGLYGFQRETLREIVRLSPSALEQTESLEQLRWLENGYEIQVASTEADAHGVDTPEDLMKVQSLLNERKDA